MRPKTTTALALTGTLLAAPVALAAEANDPPSPARAALRADVGGYLTLESQMRAEARQNRQQDLIRRAVDLTRRIADARGERFDAGAERAPLTGQAPDELLEHLRGLRRDLRNAEAPASPTLEAIAACESGGNPRAIGGGGLYRGKYQFDLATWQAVGGTGDPAQASEAEQDRRAAMLYERAGASPWPVCGR
jgi:hypothetical protein